MPQKRKRTPPSAVENAAANHELVQRHGVQLSEHFSSVTIIATRLEANGSTSLFVGGSGDVYARVKAAETWADRISDLLIE